MTCFLFRVISCVLITLAYSYPVIEESAALYNTTTQPLPASAPADGRSHCSTQIFPWRDLSAPDCLQASRKLPRSHVPGNFHTGNPADDFQLPRSATYDGCTVEISFIGRGLEDSSWVTVKGATHELIRACGVIGVMGLTKPGWITTGPSQKIKIITRKPRWGEEVTGGSVEKY